MIDDNRSFAPTASRRPGPPEAASVLPTFAALILAIALNVMVLAKVGLPIARPVLGFWFVIVFPSYLLFTTSVWRKCGLQERLGYSVCSVLLVLMLTGLVINEVLPLVGVQRPLDAGPIVIVGDLINLSLYVFRSRNPDKISRITLRVTFAQFSREEFRLLVAAALTVVLAVFGANHLNNGASGNITLTALVIVALVGAFSVRWLRFIRETVMSVVIYLISLSLLLTSSLRGWYVTGHDIQQEYLVFQLTEVHGRWSMAYFQDAYNACLSITILPTELGEIINVDSPYVFKIFFQLIFALCPVLTYSLARRYFNRGISALSVAYFVGFPTFFTDMPFLNRQEMALLFVTIGLLAATNPVWSFRRRQISLCVAGLGTEISHYSTMYVFVGTLVIALFLSYFSRLFIKSDPAGIRPDVARPDLRHGGRRWAPTLRGAVSIGLVAVFVGIVFAWGTLATKTTGAVLSDGKQAFGSGNVSVDAPYPAQNVLNSLRANGQQARIGAPQGTYLPWSAVSNAATPIIDQPPAPLTGIGRELSSLGLPVATINSLAQGLLINRIEELFLVVGLVRLLLAGVRQKRLVGGQFFWLPVGSAGMVVLITVVPSIGADYGVLRAYQQGLVFFAPVIVYGSLTVFAALGRYGARLAASAVCLGIFLATTTIIPQILGGESAALNLNNTGFYYDLYYTTPREASAIAWLGAQPDVLAYPMQAGWDVRRFALMNPNSITGERVIDEYPAQVYQNSWVILGNSVTSFGASFYYDNSAGATIEYKYPQGLLYDYKNLVYTDGGAIIYK